MTPSLTLSTAPLEHPAMDYTFLRKEGIRHLERMAGKLWTDFNAHDPGITILEQVCYALTDLANRINYDLPDLLASATDQPENRLFSPAEILTSHPVTLSDLRKLVVDVEGVKNAWVEKVTAQPIPLYFKSSEKILSLQEGDALTTEQIYLKGLYRVLIELSDVFYIDSTVEEQKIIREVAHRLHAHSGLCEDFAEIRVLEPEDIQVHARVEIEAVDDAESVLLTIYKRIANYISPPVRFKSLDQLLEAGKRVDEIFDGPLLEHGFVDSDALKQAKRRTELHTSDLIREIMDVPEVRAVKNISISSEGGIHQEWTLKLDENKTPKLKIDRGSPTIKLARNQLDVSVDDASIITAWEQWQRHSVAIHKPEVGERDLKTPQGRDRNIGNYFSLQHQFPATYGIGAMGLPDSATPQRKAQAKQLKAYLMFFDQLLANYFSQLAHAKNLFSFSGDSTQTYFSQPIDDPNLGLEGIRKSEPAAHKDKLQKITENPQTATDTTTQPDLRRRNHFLNHLLAMFAEQFTDYSLVLFGAMPKDGTPVSEKLIHDKQAFLQNYPQLSSARGTAFNYLSPMNHENRSGLEKRIRHKLGIVDSEEDFYMVEHILLRPVKEDAQQQVPILSDIQRKDPYSLQISFVFSNWSTRYNNPEFKKFIERTIRTETPAHLVPYIHWLDKAAMAVFKSAYQDWLDKRRDWWKGKF